MPEVSIDIEIWCECGEGLCNQSSSDTRKRQPSITVEPCQKCLDAKYDEGKNDGYSEGYSDKEKEGE